jgi:arylsulfatase A-like enzyme
VIIGLAAFIGLAADKLLAADKPNVLVIFADDMGYADLGITGNKDLATPHIDSLATCGARFTNGYVTGCVCSPSRAGLLTGRYQQRFGFDANAEGRDRRDASPRALDLKQVTFAQRMKEAGYTTGLVGKWHLGMGDGYLPNDRGFEEFYGLLPHGLGKQDDPAPLFRNREPEATPPDHTLAFGKEAEAFIERHAGEPFFLYLAFTAVHSPHIAPESYLKKLEHVTDPRRRKYLAMLACLDDAIGGVLARLRERKLEENTLIFFASDNGGPDSPAHDNGPYRGGKWSLWEGGIRSPLIVQWKRRIPAGREVPQLATQLDFLPTALAAAGVQAKPEWRHDGANLLPLLVGQSD